MKWKKIAIAMVAFNVGIVAFLAAKRLYFSSSGPQVDPYADQLNAGKRAVYDGLPITDSDIVFIGDSQIEKFPLEEMFPGRPIKNRGIGGNKTSHILDRLPKVLQGHPAKVFLEGGINDFHEGIPVDTVFAHYRRMIDLIKERSPKTMVYLQATLPVSPSCADWRSRREIVTLNASLKSYCQVAGATFIDLYPAFAHDGALPDPLSWDGLHLNYRGYCIWRDQVRPYL